MKVTNLNSNRFPRKLKKEIISKFGRDNYKRLLHGNLSIKAKLITYYGEKIITKFEGYHLFFTLID